MRPRLDVQVERFALREPFTLSRGAKTEAVVVVATITQGPHRGRGEAVPYARYGESVDSVARAIEGEASFVADGGQRDALLARMPAGAARSALDLALVDLECKRAGVRAHALLGLEAPRPVAITRTIPILDPDATRARAMHFAHIEAGVVLKLKLGRPDDEERVRAAREGAPAARLLADVNEGWDQRTLDRMTKALAEARIELLEQPLPATDDAALRGFEGPFVLCADESFHGDDVEALADRYQALNVKIDKQGGLTGSLAALRRAEAAGLDVFLGCMVASSLAIAPAMFLASRARWVDLDGATFLREDRPDALAIDAQGYLHPPSPALYG